MKDLYSITNIINTQGKLLDGWTIWVRRQNSCCEYQVEVYYKDDMMYWISPYSKDLVKLINEAIDKIEQIIKNIPEDALNSKQQWSHVKSFGNFGEREFIMLLKCNGRAELKRFCKTNDIFNHITNFIPDSMEMLEESWSTKPSDIGDVEITDNNIKNNSSFSVNMFNKDCPDQECENDKNQE